METLVNKPIRSISADFIKAISIFGVVFIHGSFILGCTSLYSEAILATFRFGVPCFILLWAFFFEKSYSKKTNAEKKAYILGRLKHLFIVFLIWSVLYFLLLADLKTLTITKLISVHFSGYGWSGQYFFIILFQLLIFYPLIRLSYDYKILRYITLFIIIGLYIVSGYFFNLLPGFAQKISYRPFIYWLPYIYTGIYLARAQSVKKISIIFVLAVLLIPIEYFYFKQNNISHSDYITPGILIGSTIFCISLLQYNFKIEVGKLYKAIQYIGSNTMIVFVANPLTILGLHYILPSVEINCNIVLQLFLPIISAVIITTICLIIGQLFKNLKVDKYLS